MSKVGPIIKAGTTERPKRLRAPRVRAPRESVFLAATIVEKQTGKSFEGRIRNLSATGALLQFPGADRLSGEITVTFRGVADISANVVRAVGPNLGVRFDGQIEPVACRKSVHSETSGVPDWFHNIVAYYKSNRRPGLS